MVSRAGAQSGLLGRGRYLASRVKNLTSWFQDPACFMSLIIYSFKIYVCGLKADG